MQKIVFSTTALLAVAGVAQAEVGPYIGADYVYSSVDYADNGGVVLEEKLNGANGYVGFQLNDYVGVEASYLQTEEADKKPAPGYDSTVKMSGFAADIVGTLPVTEDGTVALLGSAGFGRYKAEIDLNTPFGNGSGSDKDTAYRAGVGAQFQVTPALGVRAMARYIDVSFEDVVDHVVTGSVGLNYKF